MVREVKNIKVLSYLRNSIVLSCRNHTVLMEASDGVDPTVEYLTFEDIEYINSRSPVFKTGMIEFDEQYKSELYDELHINAENCLYERDINNLLLKPCAASLQRIVAVTDVHTIERIRGHMAVVYGSVTQDVRRVVEGRFNEINLGVRKSAFAIDHVQKPNPIDTEMMEALKRQLKEEMRAEMRAEMESMQSQEDKPAIEENADYLVKSQDGSDAGETEELQPVAKKRGRPAKSAAK